ncbi:hypothetical protein CERSUDRAFT_160869 [Gelatoporia subvermispora B]|uniref:HAT C-terminal dimerisation domain-containing protein n=1 Tax=Ceriporiopsis subvermispora (strain B) TaxID=914234 RepID=M2PBC2_CERS8|nr:hypothetical protein CERSUDRAFT_160869 [Gelatoporia subvermispora B]
MSSGNIDTRDELDRYLAADCESTSDTLRWWQERRHIYPRLSRMAMNYLSIPPTSVDVERVFSRGRLLLSHIRNGLSARSVRALLCLGEWVRLGFLTEKDIIACLRGTKSE